MAHAINGAPPLSAPRTLQRAVIRRCSAVSSTVSGTSLAPARHSRCAGKLPGVLAAIEMGPPSTLTEAGAPGGWGRGGRGSGAAKEIPYRLGWASGQGDRTDWATDQVAGLNQPGWWTWRSD